MSYDPARQALRELLQAVEHSKAEGAAGTFATMRRLDKAMIDASAVLTAGDLNAEYMRSPHGAKMRAQLQALLPEDSST